MSSTDTRWDDAANNVIAMSAAFSYYDEHRENFNNLIWSDDSFCKNYEDFHCSSLIQANRADFLDSSSQPQPENVSSARVHPEAVSYIGAFEKEVAAFHRRGMAIPPIYLSAIFRRN